MLAKFLYSTGCALFIIAAAAYANSGNVVAALLTGAATVTICCLARGERYAP